MDNETMVNGGELQESVAEEVVETGESIETVLGGESKPAEEIASEEGSHGTNEPGYVQTRIEKALNRERDRIRQELMQEFQPIRDRLLDMEATELVKSGEFKSKERAKEYLQLKQGITPTATTEEQPRNGKGQFTQKDTGSAGSVDLETQVRIKILKAQADKIKANGGPDVIAEFNSNPEIRKKVISGDMDFRDVADEMKKTTGRRPPAPTRSSNGARGALPNAFANMTSEEFANLEKRIAEGARFELK